MLPRRLALLLVLSSLLILFIAPSTARAASSWAIKDNSGNVRGQVVRTGVNTCDVVRKTTGDVVGDMFFTDGGEGWMIRWYVSNGVDYTGAMVTPPKTTSSRYFMSNAAKRVGRVTRGSSRWLICRLIHGKWRRIGSAPRGCPGQYAMGAARRLLW
jgi:hypothetical protein